MNTFHKTLSKKTWTNLGRQVRNLTRHLNWWLRICATSLESKPSGKEFARGAHATSAAVISWSGWSNTWLAKIGWRLNNLRFRMFFWWKKQNTLQHVQILPFIVSIYKGWLATLVISAMQSLTLGAKTSSFGASCLDAKRAAGKWHTLYGHQPLQGRWMTWPYCWPVTKIESWLRLMVLSLKMFEAFLWLFIQFGSIWDDSMIKQTWTFCKW